MGVGKNRSDPRYVEREEQKENGYLPMSGMRDERDGRARRGWRRREKMRGEFKNKVEEATKGT